MTMELLDRSNYLKGLLVLTRRDNVVTEEEKKLVTDCGVSLGFEKNFCETALDEILENEFISDTPPVFSNKELADCFLKDAIKVALADTRMHLYELQWLIEFSQSNELPESRINELIEYYIHDNSDDLNEHQLEIQKVMQEAINQ